MELGFRGTARLKDFNEILVECIEQSLKEIVGIAVSEALLTELYENYDLAKEELPYHLKALSSLLQVAFGSNLSKALSKEIARKLYNRFSLEFPESPDKQLIDYVGDALKTLSDRSKEP